MRDKAKLLGYPVHPMLIAFPLGLLPVAVIFDFLYLGTKNVLWSQISYWMLAAGILGGLAAAVFGVWDWMTIPTGTRAKRIGLLHVVANTVALVAFALEWWQCRRAPYTPTLPFILIGVIGLAIVIFGAWLGAELIYRLGVGVDQDAGVNAPNSLAKSSMSRDAATTL